MCTVVLEVPASAGEATRVLALRDEHPQRAWDPLGRWWANAPHLIGVHDRRAGGAWLAIDEPLRRLAVILNRAEPVAEHGRPLESRGDISLAAAQGHSLPDRPYTASFNLLEATPDGSRVTTWNGNELSVEAVEPGLHMIDHSSLNDEASPRIAAWLHRFRAAASSGSDWRAAWTAMLEETTSLDPTDDRAIVRDNQPYGIPTLTLYAVMAELSRDGVQLWHALLKRPGHWDGARFEPVTP